MQAMVSLKTTLPKNGICEAPDAYHHILYAHSNTKHGPTKMNRIFNELLS
uniref:Uncharacterized protein n=1 Tax=Rhizophora mucronata TaxID=61149 RepID=A0A2P2PMX0_RHIMU